MIGNVIYYSVQKFLLSGDNDINFKKLLANLCPYYSDKITIPVSQLGFLHNEQDPKRPIKWVPDGKYLKQVAILLSNLGFINNFNIKTRADGKKVQTFRKVVHVRPERYKEHQAPGE